MTDAHTMTINFPKAIRQLNFWTDGRLDKSGEPKFNHCVRVHAIAAFVGVRDWRAALFHDVLEDCDVLPHELEALGVPPKSVQRIEMLTIRAGEAYWKYLERLVGYRDRDAVLIKLADNIDNTAPWRMARLDAGQRTRLQERYKGAREFLEDALKRKK
jgi:(p)ppGpp synthase/HD superfamily hydrolase